jgi:small ligand-binding sensory domain FIST
VSERNRVLFPSGSSFESVSIIRSVLRAGVGSSNAKSASAAAEEAARSALEAAGLDRFDAALLFATPHYADSLPALLDAATRSLGTGAVVGATALGVLARGYEHEGVPAMALLGVRGIDARAFLLPDLRAEAGHIGEELAAQLGGPASERDLLVLLPDPLALAPGPFLEGLRRELGSARVVGAGAAGVGSAPPLQWCGTEIASGALAGIALRAGSPPRIGVTQACRPVTGALVATRVEGNWLLELDGRPALDVFREAARGPLADDLRRAAGVVLAGIPCDREATLRPGSYLVRNIVGFEESRRAFAMAQRVRLGDRIALVVREPALGAYFNCCARGSSLFRVPGLEIAYLESAFPETPIVGMLGSCELGPVGSDTQLLTYTGVLALLDA